MSEIDFSNLVTLAQFAEKAGIKTVTTVLKWATDANVKPVHKFGNTNVYLLSDLQSAMEKHSSNAKGFKALGYVHPDLHAGVVDHRDRLAVENVTLLLKLRKLTALEGAGVDNWEGYSTAMGILNGELDEAMALQYSEDLTESELLARTESVVV